VPIALRTGIMIHIIHLTDTLIIIIHIAHIIHHTGNQV